ncbi:hypothetical protein BOX15_Mlig003602g1, partial [Macrostomum lignano]
VSQDVKRDPGGTKSSQRRKQQKQQQKQQQQQQEVAMRECKVFDVVDELNNGLEDLPVVCLKSLPQSHPFSERRVPLGQEAVKIGRSVAKSKPSIDNAIFDCKVLSRNHALLWYESGQFWLKDTKSSNGTYVNNQRLGKGNEESPPRRLLSGDILQFGVEVVENSKKVTHGCVIASVFLYHADGSEDKRPDSASLSSAASAFVPPGSEADAEAVAAAAASAAAANTVSQEQVHQLSQYLQEALHRERLLTVKLDKFRELLDSIAGVSAGAWTTVLDQEQLTQRLELLEAQVAAAGVNSDSDADDRDRAAAGDSLSAAVRAGAAAEETLKRRLETALVECGAAVHRAGELERAWRDSQDECQHLRAERDRTEDRLRELGERLAQELDELGSQLAKEMERNSSLKSRIKELGEALNDGQREPQSGRSGAVERADAEAQTVADSGAPAPQTGPQADLLKAQLQACKTQLRDQQASLDASSAKVDDLHTRLESALSCLNQLETRMLELEAQKQLRQQRPRQQLPRPPSPGSNGQQNAAWLLDLLRCLRADPIAVEKAERQLLQPLLKSSPTLQAALQEVDAETAHLRASLDSEADRRRQLLADCDSLAARITDAELTALAGRDERANLEQRRRDLRAACDRQLADCRAEARAAANRSRLLLAAGVLPVLLALLTGVFWIAS